MAVGHRLPNGYVAVLLTPREATLLRDQFLEPGEYPWDKSESQMVGMEVREILTKAVSEDSIMRLGEASSEIVKMMKGIWECPNCGARNRETSICTECGFDREEQAQEQ